MCAPCYTSIVGESPFLGSGGLVEESGHVREFGVQEREPMSRSQYASAKPQPSPVVTVNTGAGSLTAGGTLYFAIQARCRGGWTLVSSMVSATYAAGDSITIQIPTTARGAGDDIRRWEILASTTNTPSTLKTVAWVEGYQLDQTTLVSLPVNLTLSRNAHIGLSQSVANPASLPTGTDLVHGMVRMVTSLATYFRYNIRSTKTVNNTTVLSAATGRWERVGNDTTFILDRTLTPGGCDRDVRIIPDADVDLPEYAADGSSGVPVNLVWYHDEGVSSPLPQGTRFSISVLVNEANKSALFKGKIKLIFRGFVNLADGTLDTSDGQGGTMAGVNETITYVPEKTGLLLQKALPQGYGYLVSVYPEFNAWELRDEIGIYATIRLFLFPFSQSGNYSEAGNFLGNVVYSDGGRLRIVPSLALGVVAMDGGAMVGSYSFLDNPITPIGGLLPNTANQQISLNGDGALFVRTGTIPSTEAIRAIVSTVAGQGTLSAFSTVQTVTGSTGQLQVTIPYPSNANGDGTIRADYPDSQLASYTSTEVQFNPPTVYIYVENQTTNVIKRFTQNVVIGTSQVFAISDWSAGTTVASIPAEASQAQGLFVPGTPTVTPSASGGNLTAGNYRVRAAFYHDGNQVSQISHGSPPALPVLDKGISNLLSTANPYTNLTASFTQPAIDGTVTINVADNRILAVGAGVIINDTANTLQGSYAVVSKTGTTSVTLRRRFIDNDIATGGTVTNSSTVLPAGIDGGSSSFGIRFNFNSNTSASPSSGELRLNNATPSNVTSIYISETDRNNANIAALLTAIPLGSTILISQANSYAYYSLISQVDNGTDRTLGVAPLATFGTFNGIVNFSWNVKGDPGSSGSSTSGFAFKYTFSSSTTNSPSLGQLRFNQTSLSAATRIYISTTDRNSKSISTLLELIGPGTGLFITNESDSSQYLYCVIQSVESKTSSVVSYVIAPSTIINNGALSGNIVVAVSGSGGGGIQAIGSTSPSGIPPRSQQSLYLQVSTNPDKEILWAATSLSSSSWIVASATPIRRNSSADPNGVVQSDFKGQILINYVGSSYQGGYTATSATMYISNGGTQWFAV